MCLGLGRVDIVHTLVAHRGSPLHPPHPLRRYVKQRIDEGVGVCPKHGEHGLGHALAVHPVLLDNLDDVVHDGLADGVALDDRRDLPIKPVEDGDSGAGARPRPGALPFGLLVAHLLGIVFTPDDREAPPTGSSSSPSTSVAPSTGVSTNEASLSTWWRMEVTRALHSGQAVLDWVQRWMQSRQNLCMHGSV